MPWYIPLLIFGARVCDVSIGTLRVILVVSGYRWAPALLGAVEVCIWVAAVASVIRYLSDPLALLGYAGGFATGVVVGSYIEDRIAIGYRLVRIVTTRPDEGVSRRLREEGFAVTQVDGQGRDGPVEIAFLMIRRSQVRHIQEVVDRISPHAFLTIDRAGPPTRGTMRPSDRWPARMLQRLGK